MRGLVDQVAHRLPAMLGASLAVQIQRCPPPHMLSYFGSISNAAAYGIGCFRLMKRVRNAPQASDIPNSALSPEMQALTRSEIRALGATVREFSFPPTRERSNQSKNGYAHSASVSRVRLDEIRRMSGIGTARLPSLCSEIDGAGDLTASHQAAGYQSAAQPEPQQSSVTQQSAAPAGVRPELPPVRGTFTSVAPVSRRPLARNFTPVVSSPVPPRALNDVPTAEQLAAPHGAASCAPANTEMDKNQSFETVSTHGSGPMQQQPQQQEVGQAQAWSLGDIRTPALQVAPRLRQNAAPLSLISRPEQSTAVLVLRLGLFRFKGAPEPMEMVHVMQEQLAGRRQACDLLTVTLL